MKSIIALLTVLITVVPTSPAHAALRWNANYGTNLDLSQWTRLDCGGQNGSCPCLAGPWPAPATDFGAGRCDPLVSKTSSSHTMPNPIAPGAGSRMQVVPDPAGSTDNVLRVQLLFGDAFDDSWSVTNRVELANDLTKGNFTAYVPGDDFYFGFSLYFPSASFDHWHCTNNAPAPLPSSYDGRCPNGVPDTSNGVYSAWNVVTQWHSPGSPSFGFFLQRLYEDSQQRNQLNMTSFDGGIWHDSGDPSKNGAIWTDVWYHFIVHIRFGTPGLIELWKSIGNGGFVKQQFNGVHNDQIPGAYPAPACSSMGPDGTSCTTNTIDTISSPLEAYFKQGLYRNPTLTDSLTSYVNHSRVGDTFNDVAAGMIGSNPNPAVATLSDSFAGSSIDSTKWTTTTQSGGSITEGGGFLHLTPNANSGATQLSIQSNNLYSLVGSSAYVQVAQVVNSSAPVDNNFALVQDPSNAVAWWFSGGTLSATRTSGGVKTTVSTLSYSPSSHVWWRIRESGGTVFWDTSADGQTWTTQGSTPTSNVPFVNSLRPLFYSETWASGSASPGEALYANFNVSPSPSGNPWADPFSDSAIDGTKWTIFTAVSGTATEGGGALSLTPAPNTTGSIAQIKSNSTASLIGNAASVKAVAVVNSANDCDEDFSLMLSTGRSNRLSWVYVHGSLIAQYYVNGVVTTLTTLTYSSTNHVYWRIRESGGTVFWDTSPDRVTWTQQASVATASLFSLTSVKAQLYAETWSSNSAAPGIAKFADMR